MSVRLAGISAGAILAFVVSCGFCKKFYLLEISGEACLQSSVMFLGSRSNFELSHQALKCVTG